MACSASIDLTQMMVELLNQKKERSLLSNSASWSTARRLQREHRASVAVKSTVNGAASGSASRPWRRVPDAPALAVIAGARTDPGFSPDTPEIFDDPD
jgi:hypothetical protein